MSTSTSGPASTRPQVRQAQSVGWSWPRLVPIPQKQPLASAAGPPSASNSIRAPSEKSNKSPSSQASQELESPNQVSLPPSPISSKPPEEKSNKSPTPKDSQIFKQPSQISLPPTLVSSKTPTEKSQNSEDDVRMNPLVPVASTGADEGPRRETMVEEMTTPSCVTDQADEGPITATPGSEAAADDQTLAETGLSSLRRAVTAIMEHLNSTENAVPPEPTSNSEAAIPTAAPTLAKAPTFVDVATPDNEFIPIERVSPVGKEGAIEPPPYIEHPFAGAVRSPVEKVAQPQSAIPMTSLPPPRITFQRATEDVEPRELSRMVAEEMEPREAVPTALEDTEPGEELPTFTVAETLNERPSTSHLTDVTSVLPDALEGAPGPVLPPLKRRKLYLRKARNLVMRKTVLEMMLGRQLAGQTKPALRTLAHGERLLPEDLSVSNAAVVS